jgi:hypothetical protein
MSATRYALMMFAMRTDTEKRKFHRRLEPPRMVVA